MEMKTAQCLLCKTDLKAHKKSLIDHTETAKHKSHVTDSVVAHNCRSIKDFDQKAINDTQSTELKISMFVAEHTSLNCVDHLGIMLKGLCATNTNCHLSNIKLHRMKASMLIKDVLSPTFREELLQDIGKNRIVVPQRLPGVTDLNLKEFEFRKYLMSPRAAYVGYEFMTFIDEFDQGFQRILKEKCFQCLAEAANQDAIMSSKSASLMPLLKQFKNIAIDIDSCMSELFHLKAQGRLTNCDCELNELLLSQSSHDQAMHAKWNNLNHFPFFEDA
uniref:Uncharacterized protein n=1 Tax=Romanomermis culicivorax TaxID=13658 RepID=A0A915LCF1_ROMCU